jgi:dipeptidyl aminopeptidase/acylaminoacyl peptidase
MRPLLLTALALCAAPLAAQPKPFDFSIANIMRGPELYGREPQRVRWSADGRWIYFQWNPPGTDWRETPKTYRVRAVAGSSPERVSDAQLDSAGPLLDRGSLSPDRRWRAVASDGDLYLLDARTGVSRRLTATLGVESSPQFSADARRVYFVRDNNVFSVDVDGGLVTQLTDVRTGPAPVDSAKLAGQRGALEATQRELFEAIRDRVVRDSLAAAERKAREARLPKPLYLLQGERVASVSVAPSGKALLLTTFQPAPRARQVQVPNYVTLSGYTEELSTRTKVGDDQAAGRVAFVSLPTGDVKWLRVVPGDTARPPATASVLGWDDAGTRALVYAVSRDFKSRVLSTVGVDSGAVHPIDVLRDSAWVGGPCAGCGGWLPNGSRVWWVGEADGYAHLYSARPDGSDKQQLTRGKFEVVQVDLSPDRTQFWLHSSEQSAFDQDFYTMPVGGGPRTRVTRGDGSHTVTPSPDGTLLADVYSRANRPPELFVQPNRPGAAAAQLTTSPTADWLSFPWLAPEIVTIPASDGIEVPARIYRPQQMNAQPNGAAVIFVHGAGYLHNVHHYWSSYAREYMFNQYLASKGYVVLDIDYRGSAGYGRDWRTAIYRHMGGRDLQDQVDGVKYLQKTFGVPPNRVGMYGGSYGGFMTLMALFTEPDWFGAGAALRSVTDWAHYNHPYTSQILNTPEQDSVAYRRSSPIYFAQGLKAPLLMAHGMVDVNVNYQDIVRLEQRLIELGKTDWSLASYPVEDHAFVRPSSWTDEYRRIFELFERTIRQPNATGTR